MNDKKQIEELAKILNECCNEYDEQGNHIRNKCFECEYWSHDNYCCCSYNTKEAEALYNAGYRKQSEWVSVDERLPEDVFGRDRKQITTLVHTKSGRISSASRVRVVRFDKTKLEWVTLDTFEWSRGLRVTHWMPLPEPPKGGAEE